MRHHARHAIIAAFVIVIGALGSALPGGAGAQVSGLFIPAPSGTMWEVLAGYNTPTHEGVDPYALDIWRVGGDTGGTPLLAPMDGTVGYVSDSCVSVRTSEVNLLMCHVYALDGLRRGDPVTVGQPLGTVAPAGEAGNGGTAHIHLQLNARGSGGSNSGTPLPFDGPYAIEGVSLPARTTFNAHAGARFTSTNSTTQAMPKVSAGDDFTVEPGATGLLVASGVNVTSYHWTQIEGPPASLQAEGATASFVASTVPGVVKTFRVTGLGTGGTLATDTVRVTVEGGPTLISDETRGRILGEPAPAQGFGLVVFGGGTNEELIAATGCASAWLTLWTVDDGRYVVYVPDGVALLNARWDALFAGGVPAGQPILVRCEPIE